MTPQPIPDSEHVLRHAKPRLVRRDDDNKVVGVYPEAFKHRDDEEYLSATWIEHFDSDYEVGFIMAAEAIRRQLPNIKPKAGLVASRAGDIREVPKRFGLKVRVLHEPDPPRNSGYCAIRRLRGAELDVLEALAVEAVREVRLSKDVPPPS